MDYEDYCIKCPHCGYQTTIDPAIDDPMPYCPECDEALIVSKLED